MCSNLGCYQLKIDYYKYKLLYVSLLVTTKKKSIVDTQKRRKESEETTKEGHQTTEEENRQEGTEEERNYEKARKQGMSMSVTACLSTVTLNVNGLTSGTKDRE